MRRILHLSDLHFGRIDAAILEPLVTFVKEKRCDVIVISGDLTQRARRAQFKEAKDFLGRLEVKQVIVPGNHDIPLYKIWLRLLRPFRNFINFISKELAPIYVDDDVAILGLNTVSFWSSEGRYAAHRLQKLAHEFRALPEGLVKILVSHHAVPAELIEAHDLHFDLMLSGHEHEVKVVPGTWKNKRSHISVQAGTATSTRVRHGQPNSFNLLELEGSDLRIASWEWSGNSFSERRSDVYAKVETGWRKRNE